MWKGSMLRGLTATAVLFAFGLLLLPHWATAILVAVNLMVVIMLEVKASFRLTEHLCFFTPIMFLVLAFLGAASWTMAVGLMALSLSYPLFTLTWMASSWSFTFARPCSHSCLVKPVEPIGKRIGSFSHSPTVLRPLDAHPQSQASPVGEPPHPPRHRKAPSYPRVLPDARGTESNQLSVFRPQSSQVPASPTNRSLSPLSPNTRMAQQPGSRTVQQPSSTVAFLASWHHGGSIHFDIGHSYSLAAAQHRRFALR